MKKNVLNSPRLLVLKRHRQRIFLNKILLSLVAFLAVFALLAYISRISYLNIKKVEVIGNKLADNQMIKENAEQEITGNYLWFFPKTNILFYPQNNIKKQLNNNFKRLKDISFSVKSDQTLEISVTERVALYTWCGKTLEDADKCYFLDNTGFIFDEAPYFSGEVYFKFYGSVQNFANLILFKNTLESMGLKPVALYKEDPEGKSTSYGAGSGDTKVFLSKGKILPKGPEIIFKSDADLETIAENLQAVLSTEPLQSNFKNKYSSLLYIDLRFGNKVYYKFR